MHKVLKINRLFTILPLFFAILSCFFTFVGCKQEQKSVLAETQKAKSGDSRTPVSEFNADSSSNKIELEFAKNFELEKIGNAYKLGIKVFFGSESNYTEYILYREEDLKTIPPEFQHLKKIRIPAKRIVPLAGNYYAYLKAIGQESKVVGFGNKDFTSDSSLYAAIEHKEITDVGSGPTLSEESLYTLHPDLVITYATGSSFDADLSKLEKAGIPVLLISEWQETSALGRLEWVKLIELLSSGSFEGEGNAENQKFNLYEIEKEKYLALRKEIKEKGVPCIKTLVGSPVNGTWHAPGENSFTGTLLADANGCSVFQSKGAELKLDLETAFIAAANAEVWINPGYNSTDALLAAEPRSNLLPAFKNKKIFYYDKLKGPSGALDFFENAGVYPSKALKDLAIILHSHSGTLQDLTWYRNIFYN